MTALSTADLFARILCVTAAYSSWVVSVDQPHRTPLPHPLSPRPGCADHWERGLEVQGGRQGDAQESSTEEVQTWGDQIVLLLCLSLNCLHMVACLDSSVIVTNKNCKWKVFIFYLVAYKDASFTECPWKGQRSQSSESWLNHCWTYPAYSMQV